MASRQDAYEELFTFPIIVCARAYSQQPTQSLTPLLPHSFSGSWKSNIAIDYAELRPLISRSGAQAKVTTHVNIALTHSPHVRHVLNHSFTHSRLTPQRLLEEQHRH